MSLKTPELLAPLTVLRAHTNTEHAAAHAMLIQNSREGRGVHLLHGDLAATCNPTLGSDSSGSAVSAVYLFLATSLIHKLGNCPGWTWTLA